MIPSHTKKFLDKSILNFDELDVILQNFDIANINAIDSEGNSYPFNGVQNNQSLIVHSANSLKEEFRLLINFFIMKTPELKQYQNDVHIFTSPSGTSNSLPLHHDTNHNYILQTVGKCRWICPNHFDVIMEEGDLIFMPAYVTHLCIPLDRRISLSFPFGKVLC